MTDFELLWKRLRSLGAEGKIRNDEWLARIRLLPCAKCGTGWSTPHHWAPAYQNMRCNDFLTIPLCGSCHTEIQRLENKAEIRMFCLEAWVRLILKYMEGK